MPGLKKYPIHMDVSEREIMCEIMSDRRHDVPSIWTQCTDKEESDLGNGDTIYMNAYEQGFIISLVTKQRDRIPDVWKQLIDLLYKFREDAGVRTIDLGNNTVQLTDNEGVTIIRQKYEWEM